MIETTIVLKPEDEVARGGMTPEALIEELDAAIRDARPHQRLDHAHPDPHRHALDRHQERPWESRSPVRT